MSPNVSLIILLFISMAICNAVHIQTDEAPLRRALTKRNLRSKGKGSKGSAPRYGKGSLQSSKSSSKGKSGKSSKSLGKGKGGKSSKSPGNGKGGKSSKSPGHGKGGKSSKSKRSKSLGKGKGGKSLKPPAEQGGSNKPTLPPVTVPGCDDIQALPCDDEFRRSCEIQQIASAISDNVPNQLALNWLLNEDTNTNSCQGVDSIIQRYTLAVFFYETDGQNWKDKIGWLEPQNECTTWNGIQCNPDGRVTKIILGK
jgi:hypothetical protein